MLDYYGGSTMNTIEIEKMSTIERLQTMEALWDSLLHDEADIDSPDWHKDIIQERMKKIESGNAVFVSIDELKASRS